MSTEAGVDAAALHADAVIVDGVNPSVPTRELLVRMRDAGVTAVNVTLAIHENQTEAARELVSWGRFLAANDGVVRPRSSRQATSARRSGNAASRRDPSTASEERDAF